jgi:divalent metal cation (Fe/Co/Zn/Cd) transporter
MPRRLAGDDRGASAKESTRTVVVALGSGFGVALAKAGAAVFTGSSALAAEASHSLADTANDLFLLVAQRRGARPADDRHPLGYGREAYFWALIAACGAFVAGAALISAYPGVTAIRELLVNFIGPGRVWIVARIDIDADLRGAQVESLVRGIESSMRRESESVYRVDVVPIGAADSSV